MQTQTYLEKEEKVEHDILLHGSIKSLKEATVELSEINSVVSAQGEILAKIQRKINQTEVTLKKASKKLSVLIRRSKNKKAFSFCLLCLTTISLFSLCVYTYKYT
ncbi:hypothetical protein NEPAR06_0119 [Nematocida parisii]|nr:hypothetical protein NEPAR03_1831 [Nematocida parisii]KAI5129991.1 hypothetical protein NEPAR08_1810 [Nematocida parisii]KAI5142628.1 hypothetical protein NEPAR04_1551 [Nematocida parisii]KAI5152998.1 hypothetical protein NEPAR06_0119 [Nematocida parisii]